MRRNALKRLFAFLAIAPALALGQEVNLGTLLDKGAVRLTKTELESLVPGTKTKFTVWSTGPQGQANVDWSWDNTTGGEKFRVFGRAPRTSYDGTGTWRISGDGRYCWDIMVNREWKACRFVFKVGDGYYMSPSADDRTVRAIPVKFDK